MGNGTPQVHSTFVRRAVVERNGDIQELHSLTLRNVGSAPFSFVEHSPSVTFSVTDSVAHYITAYDSHEDKPWLTEDLRHVFVVGTEPLVDLQPGDVRSFGVHIHRRSCVQTSHDNILFSDPFLFPSSVVPTNIVRNEYRTVVIFPEHSRGWAVTTPTPDAEVTSRTVTWDFAHDPRGPKQLHATAQAPASEDVSMLLYDDVMAELDIFIGRFLCGYPFDDQRLLQKIRPAAQAHEFIHNATSRLLHLSQLDWRERLCRLNDVRTELAESRATFSRIAGHTKQPLSNGFTQPSDREAMQSGKTVPSKREVTLTMSLNEKKFTALLEKIRDSSRKTAVPCIHDLFRYIEREAPNSIAFLRYEDERKTKWHDWGEGRSLGAWDMPLDENERKSLAYHLYRDVVECGDAGNGMLYWMYYESFELNFLKFQRDFFDVFVHAMEDVYNSQVREVTTSPTEKGTAMPDPKKVFIIHGRNVAARTALEQFLRALNLQPVDFDQLAADQGGTAFIGDIVRAGLECAQGIVALFTPDEYAGLRPDHRGQHDKPEETLRWQARPNVIFEAGMAYGMAPQRTVLVTLGTDVALFSDVAGVHVVRLHNALQSRGTLRQKLIGMRCDVDQRTDAWTDPAKSGDFDACVNGLRATSPQDPFASVVPAGPGAATSRARPLSDAGALLKLDAWLKKLPDDRYGEAMSTDQIDNECGLPEGTAERLITQAVTKAGDTFSIRGPTDGIVVLDHEYVIQMASVGSSRDDRSRRRY